MKLLLTLLCALTSSVLAQEQQANGEVKIIPTPQGPVRGKVERSSNGRTYVEFLGIPFARPPVGQLRFMPPEDLLSQWSQVRDATREGPFCPQYDILHDDQTVVGSEDCLYLNVYTPRYRETGRQPSFPVMVFFHGGAFIWGTGSQKYYGAKYMLDHDVILVTVNYRLGPFGFLSTGDDVVPGNMGLKDQVMALKWIKRNIMSYGGDPNSVTIWGHVAGASSVHYHMMSPMSDGLFHRAISHSASAFSPLGFIANPKPQAVKLGLHFNCSWISSQAMVDCLRQVPFKDLVQMYHVFHEWYVAPYSTFRPTVEQGTKEKFLAEDPFALMRKRAVKSVPWLIGNTAEDGIADTFGMINNTKLLEEFDENAQRLFPIAFYYTNTANDPDAITKEIRKAYFGKNPITSKSLPAIHNLFSDRLYEFSTYQAAKLHASYGNTVYFYRFTYKSPVFNSFLKVFWDSKENLGASLHDDLIYLFNTDLFPEFRAGEDAKKMVEIMTTLWFNFAKTGNPTPPETFSLAKWEPMDSTCMKYFNINYDLGMKEDFPHQRMKFWRNLPFLDNTDPQARCRPRT